MMFPPWSVITLCGVTALATMLVIGVMLPETCR